MAYDILEVQIIFEEFEERAAKTLAQLQHEYTNIRAGRANPHILDGILVDYYGTPTPINQMANITIPEARILMISVWDVSAVKRVEKAIVDANIGMVPNNDGKNLRLIFPELTEDRRKTLAKEVKQHAENAKVALRNIRRDMMNDIKALEKNKTISEDAEKSLEADAEKACSSRMAEIDKVALAKEAEVMKV